MPNVKKKTTIIEEFADGEEGGQKDSFSIEAGVPLKGSSSNIPKALIEKFSIDMANKDVWSFRFDAGVGQKASVEGSFAAGTAVEIGNAPEFRPTDEELPGCWAVLSQPLPKERLKVFYAKTAGSLLTTHNLYLGAKTLKKTSMSNGEALIKNHDLGNVDGVIARIFSGQLKKDKATGETYVFTKFVFIDSPQYANVIENFETGINAAISIGIRSLRQDVTCDLCNKPMLMISDEEFDWCGHYPGMQIKQGKGYLTATATISDILYLAEMSNVTKGAYPNAAAAKTAFVRPEQRNYSEAVICSFADLLKGGADPESIFPVFSTNGEEVTGWNVVASADAKIQPLKPSAHGDKTVPKNKGVRFVAVNEKGEPIAKTAEENEALMATLSVKIPESWALDPEDDEDESEGAEGEDLGAGKNDPDEDDDDAEGAKAVVGLSAEEMAKFSAESSKPVVEAVASLQADFKAQSEQLQSLYKEQTEKLVAAQATAQANLEERLKSFEKQEELFKDQIGEARQLIIAVLSAHNAFVQKCGFVADQSNEDIARAQANAKSMTTTPGQAAKDLKAGVNDFYQGVADMFQPPQK